MVLMAREENGTQAIDRAARILEHLVERDDFVTLTSVVEGTQLPKSTAARLLRALERNGLAQRGVAGGFRPGPLLVDYARRDTSTADLGALARPFLERLPRAPARPPTSPSPPRPASPAWPRSRARTRSAPARGSAAASRCTRPRLGKVFMAYGAAQPPFGRLARLGPNTITSVAELLRAVEDVRERGWASTWEELEDGLCSVAAPVRGSRGPRDRRHLRLDAHRTAHRGTTSNAWRRSVVETADALSANIGRRAVVDQEEDRMNPRGDPPASSTTRHWSATGPRSLELTKQGLENGMAPETMLFEALIPALEEVGARFERGDFFVPEMLIAGRAMSGALDLLRPLLADTGAETVGTFLMGTVKGDVHDIGKNLVDIMLEGAGFNVIDLGVQVAPGDVRRGDPGAQARRRRLLRVPHDDDADVQGEHRGHREGRAARRCDHHGRRRPVTQEYADASAPTVRGRRGHRAKRAKDLLEQSRALVPA